MPLANSDELAFVQAVGARNMAFSAVVIFCAIVGLRAPLVAMFAALSALSVTEYFIVAATSEPGKAVRYLVVAAVLAAITTWIAKSRKGQLADE